MTEQMNLGMKLQVDPAFLSSTVNEICHSQCSDKTEICVDRFDLRNKLKRLKVTFYNKIKTFVCILSCTLSVPKYGFYFISKCKS